MKKITLFLDGTLRDKLQEDSSQTVAYSAALEFFAKLVAFLSEARNYERLVLGFPHEHHDSMDRFLCTCYAEGKWLRENFLGAHRVEACLTLRMGILVLELSAYRSGEKQPYKTEHFSAFERYSASRNIPARQ